METLRLTAADFTERNGRKEYTGSADVSDYAGSIEIAAGLEWVWFASLKASGYILAEAGSGIKAGRGIEAGEGIKAGRGIEAGWGIEAGSGIKAGWGIEAGFSVDAKWVEARLRIFAGLCAWRLPDPDEMEIRAELRNGVVAFGTLVPAKKEAVE